jgi:predicted esterase YcpF (UPF0227 family)
LSALIARTECYSSATDMILYLHGFRSSPQSRKAQQIKVALAARGRVDDYLCPLLPASPREAIDRVLTAIDREDPARLSLIGSSLGGYYATWLAERIGCRAVLLNPAITAVRGPQGASGAPAGVLLVGRNRHEARLPG